jgi:hypothetical protein
MMPMAPTFCFLNVFCTPAMTAPTMVVWMAELAVFARASCGWKVGGWAAMAGRVGVNVLLEAVSTVVRLDPVLLADEAR